MIVRFTVHGAPRTKKNHGRIVTVGGRPRMLPSKQWEAWVKSAYITPHPGKLPTHINWNCSAMFYRDAARGDAVGYYQGLADLLEKAGVLDDDVSLVRWDGSRLAKDTVHPRVEVVLEEVKP